MVAVAILLGALMVWLDAGPGEGLLDGIGWYQSAKADGAHQVLSTIAGSMITVAGVVFSITIVALAYAAGQYGPRVLTNFMSDRGNQVTLGTFIGTFVYCLVVLRTIRGGDSEFVPQLAVMMGLVLALCSIGVLIYFIHHVPQSIHVNSVIARIGHQLIRSVEDRYPTFIGDPPEDKEDGSPAAASATPLQLRPTEATATLDSKRSGYIQALDEDSLMEAARAADIVVYLTHAPGDYIHSGRPLLRVSPDRHMNREVGEALLRSFSIGTMRTPYADLTFLIDELVEIAARALSSGINDPYTAMGCMDWLGAGMTELARRKLPSPQRADEEGQVRVIALPETFADFVERGFGRMRQYAAGDMNAAVHMLKTMDEVAKECSGTHRSEAICREAGRLVRLAEKSLHAASIDGVRQCLATLDVLRGCDDARGSRKVDAFASR